MSFASDINQISYENLFASFDGEQISRENWSATTPTEGQEAQKRRRSTSVTVRKRARMSRGDENIVAETARLKATSILDQIKDTPGQISLNLESIETAELCPLPPNLNQTVVSQWTINQLQEGQLSSILAESAQRFKPLGIQKIPKGVVHTQVLPRQLNLKDTIANLKSGNRGDDQYIGFAAAIANILRRCDDETAEKMAQAITDTIEKEAADIINKH